MSEEIQPFDASVVTQYMTSLSPLFTEFGLTEAQVAEATGLLKQGAALVSIEASRAVLSRTPFSVAVESEDFPYLRRIHAALADILNESPPPEFAALFRRLPDLISFVEMEELSLGLAQVASSGGPYSDQSAFAQFVLFEWTRLGMLLAMYNDRPSLAHLGLTDRELNQTVENQVEKLMAAGEEFAAPHPIRPLPVLFAASLSRFDDIIQAAREEIILLSPQLWEEYQKREILEAAFASLGPLDEVLVRNAHAPVMDNQRLDIVRLSRERPIPFEGQVIDKSTRNKIDQRTTRAKKHFETLVREIATDEIPRPRRAHKSLADLIIEEADL